MSKGNNVEGFRSDFPGFGPDDAPGKDPHEATFAPVNFGSSAKDFIEPGANVEGLLMRSVLAKCEPPDPRLVVRCLTRYEKFHDKRHKDMLKALLASTVSIEGRGRMEFLMARTGILATNVLGKFLGADGKSIGKNKKGEDYLVAPKRPQEEEEEV